MERKRSSSDDDNEAENEENFHGSSPKTARYSCGKCLYKYYSEKPIAMNNSPVDLSHIVR